VARTGSSSSIHAALAWKSRQIPARAKRERSGSAGADSALSKGTAAAKKQLSRHKTTAKSSPSDALGELRAIAVVFPERDGSDPAIAQLWAQRRVADLLTELRIEGVRDSLVEEIVEIANQFGIVTPYTAYLAEEPDMAFRDDRAAFDAVVEQSQELAAAPASGKDAVGRAEALDELREGEIIASGQSSRVLGAHTFYLVGDTWTRDDFEPDTETPEVEVGSAEFLALIAEVPEMAEVAALGERVITLGPDGWIAIVWPDVEAAG